MGFKLFDDKIGTLAHSAGNITLTNSIVTIGGQQYVTGTLTRTISADVTLTAHSLYMVYAVISGGSPALRISANTNSIGPSGFTAWKLVGAFYANGQASVSFGAFVNITGTPKTQSAVDNGPLISGVHLKGSVSDPTFTTTSFNQMSWERNGRYLYHRWHISTTTTGGGGSGAYLFLLPFTATSEYTPFTSSAAEVFTSFPAHRSFLNGIGHAADGSSRGVMIPHLFDTTRVGCIATISYTTYQALGSSVYALNTTAKALSLEVTRLPIVGWAETQLVDL